MRRIDNSHELVLNSGKIAIKSPLFVPHYFVDTALQTFMIARSSRNDYSSTQ
jgi:hypothetical protein